MPKLVCVKCERELKPKHNGCVVVEMMHQDTKIYKIWRADVWKCPICKEEVVAGFAKMPFAEHYTNNCKKILQQLKSNGATIIHNYEYKIKK